MKIGPVFRIALLLTMAAACCAGPICATEPGAAAVFVNVHVVPMTGPEVLENHAVVVRGQEITEVGPAAGIEIPKGAAVIDGRGGWLMPGLADMHVHTLPSWLTSDWPVNPLKAYLAYGVTTIRCLGPGQGKGINPQYVLNWRDLIAEGRMDGPAIYTSGPILYGPVKDPAARVQRQKEAGFDFIKLYSYLTPEEFHAAMTAAREAGMYSAGHIPMMVGLDESLAAGLCEIAHVEELAWPLADIDRTRRDLRGDEWIMYAGSRVWACFEDDATLSVDELWAKHKERFLNLAEKLKQADCAVDTTLFLDELIVQKVFHPQVFLNRPETALLPASYLATFRQGREKHQRMFKGIEPYVPFKLNLDLALLRALREIGVMLVAGSDSGTGGMGIPVGSSLHQELRLLTKNGFSPYEALATATINASRVAARMTGRDEFGAIEPGRRADLLLVGGNPLADIANARDIKGFMAAGRWYDEGFVKELQVR